MKLYTELRNWYWKQVMRFRLFPLVDLRNFIIRHSKTKPAEWARGCVMTVDGKTLKEILEMRPENNQ
jgi:hypothetical protein